MTGAQSTAPVRASAEPCRAGVVHIRRRLGADFTIVPNQLALDAHDLVVIGLGTYLMAVPEGTTVSIQALRLRFKQGEKCLSAALNELEERGFLERVVVRVAAGRMRTRTYVYNDPRLRAEAARERRQRQPEAEQHPPAGRKFTAGQGLAADRALPGPRAERADTAAEAAADATADTTAQAVPNADTAPDGAAGRSIPAYPARAHAHGLGARKQARARRAPAHMREPRGARTPGAPGAGRASEPLPVGDALADVSPEAVRVLAGLRHRDPRLLLSVPEIARLAPAVGAWLRRGVAPGQIAEALSGNLPDRIEHRPAALLAYRLSANLPPDVPPSSRPGPAAPGRRPGPEDGQDGEGRKERPSVAPLINCDGCDRAHRSHTHALCRDCRNATATTTASGAASITVDGRAA
ncbi:hypothetical protein [Streptomyces thermolineatus]|uniref:hypothetical protein n=2 Tax=Streptomyces TaxID=1883 RepID=UPI003850F587